MLRSGRQGLGVVVLVVVVVDVCVLVLDRFVPMAVRVPYGQMQPYAGCHERACTGKLWRQRIARQQASNARANVQWSSTPLYVPHRDGATPHEQHQASTWRAKPTIAPASTTEGPGTSAPASMARRTLVVPAASPLAMAMKDASASATLRVRLLSSAHSKQAPDHR